MLPDHIPTVAQEVRTFAAQFDYVLTSGGIGPTHDDLTFEGGRKNAILQCCGVISAGILSVECISVTFRRHYFCAMYIYIIFSKIKSLKEIKKQ